jgi:phage baseplate assembly protein W
MGNREDDLNPNQWIGFQFPLSYNPEITGNPDADDIGQTAALETYTEAGFFPRTQTLRQQASHNIKCLLQTIPGERLGIPEYGSRLHHLLFEPMEENLYTKIEDEIKSSIGRWLPYIIIKRIDISSSDKYTNYVNVSIDFALSWETESIQSVEAMFEQAGVDTETGLKWGDVAASDKIG